MKEQITLLLTLHELDVKISGLQEVIAKLQPEIAALEDLVGRNRVTRDEKSAKLAEIETSKLSKEREVETSEARLKEFQGKLSQIKTNKEYQAALKEMADTKKNNKQIEEIILQLMTEMETLKKDVQESEEALKASGANLEKRQQDVKGETATIQTMIEEAEKERNQVAVQIDSLTLAKYERIRKTGRDAVAGVSGGTCQGCRMKIPPQLYIEIQKMKSIHACPSCNRLLYLPEWASEKPNDRREVTA